MNFFEIKYQVLHKHNIECLDDHENLNEYNVYMMNRYASMSNMSSALVINHLSNIYWKDLDKLENAKILINFVPQNKINFIKKNKHAKEKVDEKTLDMLQESLEISKREIEMYLNEFADL